jgi:hypothetical protein
VVGATAGCTEASVTTRTISPARARSEDRVCKSVLIEDEDGSNLTSGKNTYTTVARSLSVIAPNITLSGTNAWRGINGEMVEQNAFPA